LRADPPNPRATNGKRRAAAGWPQPSTRIDPYRVSKVLRHLASQPQTGTAHVP
jgi:hypothetical protein